MDMLTDYMGNPAIFDSAKENIFKSSQDIWSNLDNMAFIDNMEDFYLQRKEMESYMDKSPAFVKPITFNEYYQRTISKLADNQIADDAT